MRTLENLFPSKSHLLFNKFKRKNNNKKRIREILFALVISIMYFILTAYIKERMEKIKKETNATNIS